MVSHLDFLFQRFINYFDGLRFYKISGTIFWYYHSLRLEGKKKKSSYQRSGFFYCWSWEAVEGRETEKGIVDEDQSIHRLDTTWQAGTHLCHCYGGQHSGSNHSPKNVDGYGPIQDGYVQWASLKVSGYNPIQYGPSLHRQISTLAHSATKLNYSTS